MRSCSKRRAYWFIDLGFAPDFAFTSSGIVSTDVERTMLKFKLLRLTTSIDCEIRSRLYKLLLGGEPLTP